jgi:hypothetical protein
MSAPAALISASTTDKPPRPRHWVPLSLRMFVAILVLVAVGSALWIGVPAYRQSVAVKEIRRIGGIVSFESPPLISDLLKRFKFDAQADALDDVSSVWFMPTLSTFGRRFTYDNFSGPPAWIDRDVEVDDSSLACLRGIPNLKDLRLAWTNIGDAGMLHVSILRNLEMLDIEGTDVTDASVNTLKRFSSLTVLNARNTPLTEGAIAELKRALPACRVMYGEWPPNGPLTDNPGE